MPIATLPPLRYTADGPLKRVEAVQRAILGHPIEVDSTRDLFALSDTLRTLDVKSEYRFLRKARGNAWTMYVVLTAEIEAAFESQPILPPAPPTPRPPRSAPPA